jgi:hypothetical protein
MSDMPADPRCSLFADYIIKNVNSILVTHCPKEFGIILYSMRGNVFQNTLEINNYKFI